MKKSILLYTVFVFLFISGCKNKDNPVEPDNPGSTDIMYDGKVYSADSLTAWGMGKSETEYYHNDKDYNWYIDQGNTGPASGNNCGPTSVTMAAKWYNKDFSKTAEDARNMYPNDNGWWYTNNIIDYLNYYKIPNTTLRFNDYTQLESIIKDGNIAILCISTAYFKFNGNSRQRVDRFYSYASGHFFVVKGVRKVDNETYFEVYDPNNWNAKYSDNSPKGKNRHYRASEISEAVTNWWDYMIVISKNKLSKKFDTFSVEPNSIPNAWGR